MYTTTVQTTVVADPSELRSPAFPRHQPSKLDDKLKMQKQSLFVSSGPISVKPNQNGAYTKNIRIPANPSMKMQSQKGLWVKDDSKNQQNNGVPQILPFKQRDQTIDFSFMDDQNTKSFFDSFKPAPSNPKINFEQFKRDQNQKFFDPLQNIQARHDDQIADMRTQFMELGMTLNYNGNDPVIATSVLLNMALNKVIPYDENLVDVCSNLLSNKDKFVHNPLMKQKDLQQSSDKYNFVISSMAQQKSQESNKKIELPKKMVDFWEMQKNDYDPLKMINQISKGKQQAGFWGKIKMNGEDNFGNILEIADRNILIPKPA